MPLCYVSNRVITPLLAFFCAVFCAFFLTNGASAQSFSGGEIIYIKTHHNTYLYMANGDLKAGQKQASSKMELVRVSGSGPIKFGDRIALKSADGSAVYVTAMNDGENYNAVARAPALNEWETFTIVNRSGATPDVIVTVNTPFALRGAHSRHVAATPDGQAVASVPHINDWEMFRWEAAPIGESFNSGETVYIKTHHNTYLYMANGDLKAGQKQASSKIELVRVGGSGPIKFGDRIALKSVDGSAVYVTAMHDGENYNAVARAPALNEWETFTIVNRSGNTPNTVVTSTTPFALRSAHKKNGNDLHIAATPTGEAKGGVPHIHDWEMFRLEVYTASIPALPGENIATKGTATQSSMGWGGVASRAIDGNTDGLYGGGSVTHTNGAASWWKVALDKTYRIDAIRIYNRATAQDRLDQFKVEVLKDGAVVQTYGPFNTFSEAYFDVPGVNGATGNEVRISIPGQYLSLAEVQIHGTEAPPTPSASAGPSSTPNPGASQPSASPQLVGFTAASGWADEDGETVTYGYPKRNSGQNGAYYKILKTDQICESNPDLLLRVDNIQECAQFCAEVKGCQYVSLRGNKCYQEKSSSETCSGGFKSLPNGTAGLVKLSEPGQNSCADIKKEGKNKTVSTQQDANAGTVTFNTTFSTNEDCTRQLNEGWMQRKSWKDGIVIDVSQKSDLSSNSLTITDKDGDGYHTPLSVAAATIYAKHFSADTLQRGDCNDHDATIHPGGKEIANDGIDQDCDGQDAVDLDKDGWFANADGANRDCNDGDPTINPGATELLNDLVDQNCDGFTDHLQCQLELARPSDCTQVGNEVSCPKANFNGSSCAESQTDDEYGGPYGHRNITQNGQVVGAQALYVIPPESGHPAIMITGEVSDVPDPVCENKCAKDFAADNQTRQKEECINKCVIGDQASDWDCFFGVSSSGGANPVCATTEVKASVITDQIKSFFDWDPEGKGDDSYFSPGFELEKFGQHGLDTWRMTWAEGAKRFQDNQTVFLQRLDDQMLSHQVCSGFLFEISSDESNTVELPNHIDLPSLTLTRNPHNLHDPETRNNHGISCSTYEGGPEICQDAIDQNYSASPPDWMAHDADPDSPYHPCVPLLGWGIKQDRCQKIFGCNQRYAEFPNKNDTARFRLFEETTDFKPLYDNQAECDAALQLAKKYPSCTQKENEHEEPNDKGANAFGALSGNLSDDIREFGWVAEYQGAQGWQKTLADTNEPLSCRHIMGTCAVNLSLQAAQARCDQDKECNAFNWTSRETCFKSCDTRTDGTIRETYQSASGRWDTWVRRSGKRNPLIFDREGILFMQGAFKFRKAVTEGGAQEYLDISTQLIPRNRHGEDDINISRIGYSGDPSPILVHVQEPDVLAITTDHNLTYFSDQLREAEVKIGALQIKIRGIKGGVAPLNDTIEQLENLKENLEDIKEIAKSLKRLPKVGSFFRKVYKGTKRVKKPVDTLNSKSKKIRTLITTLHTLLDNADAVLANTSKFNKPMASQVRKLVFHKANDISRKSWNASGQQYVEMPYQSCVFQRGSVGTIVSGDNKGAIDTRIVQCGFTEESQWLLEEEKLNMCGKVMDYAPSALYNIMGTGLKEFNQSLDPVTSGKTLADCGSDKVCQAEANMRQVGQTLESLNSKLVMVNKAATDIKNALKPVADLVDDAADTAEKLKLGWVSKLLDGFCSLFSWSPVSPCDALDWVGELEDKLCEATLGAAGAGEICGGGINFNLLEGTALTSQLDGLNTDLNALKIALEVVKTGEKLNELKDKFKTNKKIKDVLDKRATVNAVRDGLKGGLSSAVMAELGCAGKTPHQCIIDKMKEQMEKECAGVD